MWLLWFLIFLTGCNASETRSRIVVIDTGLTANFPTKYRCIDGDKDFTNTDLLDKMGHGTIVANLIIENMDASEYCINTLKWVEYRANDKDKDAIYNALKHAATLKGVKYINMSLAGRLKVPKESAILNKLMKKGVTIVVAAGNDGYNLSKGCIIYPACYYKKRRNYIVVADSCEGDISGNFNGPVNAQECGRIIIGSSEYRGTSFSSGIHLGRLVGGYK